MAYAFERPDRLAFEIRRVAFERLESALGHLGPGLAEDPAEAVHAARKDLKKTRSLLRFAKDSLGADRFRFENDRLREAAHHLAGARERDALAEALTALIETEGGSLSPEASGGVRIWQARMATPRGRDEDVRFAAGRASGLIARARADARTWRLGYGSFDLIEPGIRRTYRQGRRYLERSAEDPSDETLHEWRKRVKDMWYSLRLIGPAWEEVIRPLADEAHRLSDLLGDHHDLGELRRIVESRESGLSVPSGDEIIAAATARQADLHEAAISIGRRLFAERPRRYTMRLTRIWAAWEEDSAQQLGQDGLPSS